MPIYTPRGLKIRVDPVYAFNLMCRLEPRISPFKVLETTEAIERIPEVFSILTAILVLNLRVDAFLVFGCVALSRIIGAFITRNGILIFPGIIWLDVVYRKSSKYGFIHVVLFVLGWLQIGWKGAIAYILGMLGGMMVNGIFEMKAAKKYHAETGAALMSSETNFFNAYRLYASRLGISTDLDLTVEEEKSNDGMASLIRFSEEFPEIAMRFE